MKYVTGGPERYQHQKQGLVDILANKGKHALIFDPGCGKTATALDYAALLALKFSSRSVRVLVIAPVAAVDTWVIQAPLWCSPDVNVWAEVLGGTRAQKGETLAERGGKPFTKATADTALSTYARAMEKPATLHLKKSVAVACRLDGETLTGDDAKKVGLEALCQAQEDKPLVQIISTNIETFASKAPMRGTRTPIHEYLKSAVQRYSPDLIIIDESHKLKGPSAIASNVIYRIAKDVPRRLLLTGTLMPHSPLDVWAQWRILDDMAFCDTPNSAVIETKPLSFGRFKQRYGVLGGFMGRDVVSFRNLDHLQSVIAKHSTIVKKEDALDLPPTTDVVVPVHLSPREQRAYDTMKKDLFAELTEAGEEVQTVVALSQLTKRLRLRQITAGHLPLLDDDGEKTTELLGTSKVDTIRSIVNDNLEGENRVVVFGVFTHEIDEIAKALEEKGTTVQKVTGATSQAQRIAYREAFKDTAKHPERIVMVAQIKTMSVAVNELVTASHAVFASLSEQRDDLIQARDRLNRIGQTRPVTFWFALAPGTVDEIILYSHQRMTNLEGAILEHIKN